MRQNVANEFEEFDEVTDVIVSGIQNPCPNVLCHFIGMGHIHPFQKGRGVFVQVKRIHLNVNTSAPKSGNEIFGGRTDENEPCNVAIRFHRPP